MKQKKGLNIFRWESFLAAFLVLEVLVFGGINPKMLSINTLLGSIDNFMSIAVIALFVTFVLITGGMDIQAGAIVGLTSITIGLLWQDLGLNIWVAALISIIAGGICGAISGFFIAYAGVQAMVVTLGGQFLYSGLAIVVSNLSSTESYQGISGFPAAFSALTKGKLLGVIPNQFIIFVVLTIFAYILLHRTKYGRKIFLCGINQNASEFAGIRSKRIIMSTYVLSGMGAAVAGVLITSYLGTAKSDIGKELTLPIITAVVLGGTSNLGGKGNVIGTALAAFIIGILRFGLSMANVPTQYYDIPVGILLIVAVAGRAIMAGDTGIKIPKLLRKKT